MSKYHEWDKFIPFYVPPTQKELQALLAAWGLTPKVAGLITGTHSRAARRWLSGEREISFSHFYTLVHRFAKFEISPWNWRAELEDVIKIGMREKYYALAAPIDHLLPPKQSEASR